MVGIDMIHGEKFPVCCGPARIVRSRKKRLYVVVGRGMAPICTDRNKEAAFRVRNARERVFRKRVARHLMSSRTEYRRRLGRLLYTEALLEQRDEYLRDGIHGFALDWTAEQMMQYMDGFFRRKQEVIDITAANGAWGL